MQNIKSLYYFKAYNYEINSTSDTTEHFLTIKLSLFIVSDMRKGSRILLSQ